MIVVEKFGRRSQPSPPRRQFMSSVAETLLGETVKVTNEHGFCYIGTFHSVDSKKKTLTITKGT
jgi:hypothetical protein